MRIRSPMRIIAILLIVCVTTLWLRELTLRKAIDEADHYMMPFVVNGKLCRTSYRFTWLDTTSEIGRVGFRPGWNIGYEPVYVLGNGLYVRVPVFGEATGTTHWEYTHALNLPLGEERKQAVEKLLSD